MITKLITVSIVALAILSLWLTGQFGSTPSGHVSLRPKQDNGEPRLVIMEREYLVNNETSNEGLIDFIQVVGVAAHLPSPDSFLSGVSFLDFFPLYFLRNNTDNKENTFNFQCGNTTGSTCTWETGPDNCKCLVHVPKIPAFQPRDDSRCCPSLGCDYSCGGVCSVEFLVRGKVKPEESRDGSLSVSISPAVIGVGTNNQIKVNISVKAPSGIPGKLVIQIPRRTSNALVMIDDYSPFQNEKSFGLVNFYSLEISGHHSSVIELNICPSRPGPIAFLAFAKLELEFSDLFLSPVEVRGFIGNVERNQSRHAIIQKNISIMAN